jgi:hypothetical protein
MSLEDRRAIDERRELIAWRALALAESAIASGAPWARRLGQGPVGESEGARWLRVVSAVAAYRDRYKVTSDLPLGGRASTDAQRADRQRAQGALRDAVAMSRTGEPAQRSATPAIHAVSGP